MSPQSAKRKSVTTRKRRLPVAEKEPVEADSLTMACSETEMPSCSSQNMNNLDERVGSKKEEMSQEGSNDSAPVSRRKRITQSSNGDTKEEVVRLPCDLCSEIIFGKSEMTKHLKNHHPPQGGLKCKSSNGDTNDGVVRLPCKLCPKTISGNSEMTKHLKSHHPPQESLICKVCSRQMSSRSSLDRHFLVHSGEKPFKCPMCPQRFSTNGNLHRHRRTHFENKNAGKSIVTEELPKNHVNEPSGAVTIENRTDRPPSGVFSLPIEALSPPSSRVVPSGTLKPPSRADTSLSEVLSPPSRVVSQGNENVSPPNRSRKRFHPSASPPAKKARAEASKPTEKQVKTKSKAKPWRGPPPPLLFQVPFSLTKFPLLANTKEAQDAMPRKDTPLYRCPRCHEEFLDLEVLHEHEASHMEMSIPDSDLLCRACQVTHGSFCEFTSHRMSTTCEPEGPDSSQCRFLKQFDLYQNDQNLNSQTAEIVPSAISQVAEILPYTNSQGGDIDLNANSQLDEGNTDSLLDEGNTDSQLDNGNMDLQLDNGNMDLQLDNGNTDSQLDKGNTDSQLDERNTDSQLDNENTDSQLDNENTDSQLEEDNPDSNSQQEDHDPVVVADANSLDIEDSERSSENSNDFADIGSILSNVSASPEQSCLERLSQPQVEPRNSKRKGKPTVYPCPVEGCRYASPDKSGVKRHMMTHTKEHPFICKFREGEDSMQCGREFTTKANAERHARNKHNLKEERSLVGVIEFNSSSGLVIECPYGCPQVFNSEKAKDHHLRATKFACTQKPFRCKICHQGFGSKNNYNRHFKDKHRAGLSDERFEEERVKNCIENKTRPKKGSRCSSSSEAAQSIQPASVPERIESEALQVWSMILMREKEKNLRKNHHEPPASPSNPSYGKEATIEKALSSFSGEDDQPDGMSEVSLARDSGIGSEEEPLDLSLHALDLRSNSYAMHTGSIERRHSLTDRGRIFERHPFPSFNPTFTSPILHSVPITPPLALPLDLCQRVPPCNFCGKTFSSQVSRDHHIQKDHSGQDVLVATRVLQNTDNIQQQLGEKKQPVASQGGSNSDTENVDLASVRSVIDTANSPCFGQFLLTNCDTSTPQKGKSKENKHQCKKCPSSFPSRSGLKRHQAKHTGKKEFECNVCGQRFSTKSNLTRHSKNIHEDSGRLPSSGSSSLGSPGLLTADESPENSSDAEVGK